MKYENSKHFVSIIIPVKEANNHRLVWLLSWIYDIVIGIYLQEL
jgi:hypothetical protein